MGSVVVLFSANLLALVQTSLELYGDSVQNPKNLESRQGSPRQIGIHPSSQAPSRVFPTKIRFTIKWQFWSLEQLMNLKT